MIFIPVLSKWLLYSVSHPIISLQTTAYLVLLPRVAHLVSFT